MRRREFLILAAAPKTPEIRVLSDDGGWCWFEDERAIVAGDKLIFGTVASGRKNPARKGNIEVVQYDLKRHRATTFTLHRPERDQRPKEWMDDHNSPAFLARPDGRLLVCYARHNTSSQIHSRLSSKPLDAAAWEEEKLFVPSPSSRVTYSNLFLLKKENGGRGRVYDFYRGFNNSFKPSYSFSDDFGETWTAGGVVIDVPAKVRHRPYVKYCSNGQDTVHLAYTEGHPDVFDNSVYHVFCRDGRLHRSDGTPIRGLEDGLRDPREGTRIFQGDANNVAWTTDFHVMPQGELALLYTVQKDGGGLPPREKGRDHRFRLARWSGGRWEDHEIAYAGSRLYPTQEFYTGLAALDPFDPRTVYISTDADPVSGEPLISRADQRRHRELFRGTTLDGKSFRWTAVTKDSSADQVRPIIPIWPGKRRAVLWLRGVMRAYTDYDFEVAGLVENR
ncbi:MAG: BNR-4 repeat-containing protein [Acidobacteria bacterium]|nr:BNR-4 repeat-containing protein [Acidobacteriota bacterium]